MSLEHPQDTARRLAREALARNSARNTTRQKKPHGKAAKRLAAKIKARNSIAARNAAMTAFPRRWANDTPLRQIAKALDPTAQVTKRSAAQIIAEYLGIDLEKEPTWQAPARHTPQKRSDFYSTDEWRTLRYEALRLHGRRCQCCGRQPPGVTLHVDHVQPISKHPELKLQLSNLQILCEDCNLGKSNKHADDWRNHKATQ